ncbi:MAG: tRNA (adenosine(37)-N6)-threonylcarbamoyltransferase complex transferase subunit TsaD [Bdellovibrionales bacterium]
MLVLGIETSCDDTAVGIVDGDRRILANRVATQLEEHRPFGGVVPEIAARSHLAHMRELVRGALDDAKLTLGEISGVAATCGPGLIGGVMVGAMMGKAMAAARGLPFVAVNHLEAHGLTARLTHDAVFPYLLLLVSGGHCQLLLARGVGDFQRLGTTMDDAVGECFDKGAKLLGLGYPGGPALERAALHGNPKAFDLPRPLVGRAGCDFSFSGLKTAVRQLVEAQHEPLSAAFVADAAASLQAAIVDILADRVRHAFDLLRRDGQAVTALVLGGGVAANKRIGAAIHAIATDAGVPCLVPQAGLCTDNGVMVAWAGLERLRLGLTDGYDIAARPRWPLEALRLGS